MSKARMEAFSDGVLAIIITIMVLELKVPHGTELAALRSLTVVFLSYALSFVYLGIYWNNHHHMLHVTRGVDGRILWANLHLLFWLSLVPFVTAWMGESHLAPAPTASYGVILLCAALSYLLLRRTILAHEGPGSLLASATGRDRKGWISTLLYGVAIPVAFLRPWVAGALYALGALLWLVPDRRMEGELRGNHPAD